MAKEMRCPECGGSEFRGLIPIDASATFGIEDLDEWSKKKKREYCKKEALKRWKEQQVTGD